MSPSIKVTGLLALASAVSAVPHYQHNKFHHRAAYPTGGWGGAYNSSVPAGATGTGAYGDDKTTTLGMTSTSTQTLYSTVLIKPSGGPDAQQANVADASTCGGTVTVTANEKVTVTVTPGGGAAVPTPSGVAGESSADNGYGASSSAAEYPAETPVEATSSVVKTPVETPAGETSKAAEYPAETPEATTSSKAVETPVYTPSVVQKPVASSTVSSASTPYPSAANTYSGAKRGLAYNDAGLCKSFGSNFGFAYNWGQTENGDIGTSFIPMMHKPSDSTVDEWLANVDTAAKKGSTAVMGFNECDIASQCNMEPEAACSAWKEYMNPVKDAHSDITIIGPSVSNGQAPLGIDWLSRFMDCCPDAKVDATNIHFYDIYDEGTVDRFTAHVEKAVKDFGKKVWVTEFGLNPGSASEEQAATFLKDAMAYLDASNDVQGYSYFMVGSGENQLNSGEGLSAVGKVYAGSS
ncbi:glycoside hydrolase family 128 protein [Stemphylium lycopersici]|uniref:Glycoside hydrolase family 128 protein n=1 Tax=Stemphylium lycopersici TaxID=183478 RepID=A0A364N272_STELY|nr:glycoside hydrolase family 128 protein [Stemphylium lycopersici]RAR02242.1 glycoside hydrolase family 128 protein [Stemphylium lycopersici]RAR09986.1 glycoside hydrolase family 128 protein [Stemphylium lycopersici]